MSKTRHFQSRMSQRGINQGIIDLTIQFGVIEDDKIVVSEKQLKALITSLDQVRNTALKAIDKGGMVVVSSSQDGALITAYRLDSYRRQAS